jgi:hypothetical protein
MALVKWLARLPRAAESPLTSVREDRTFTGGKLNPARNYVILHTVLYGRDRPLETPITPNAARRLIKSLSESISEAEAADKADKEREAG